MFDKYVSRPHLGYFFENTRLFLMNITFGWVWDYWEYLFAYSEQDRVSDSIVQFFLPIFFAFEEMISKFVHVFSAWAYWFINAKMVGSIGLTALTKWNRG